MKKHRWLAAAILFLIMAVSCQGSGDEQSSQKSPSPSSSSSKSSGKESGGKQSDKAQAEDHAYIEGAKTVLIDPIEADQLDISDVVFVGEQKIVVSYPRDIGEVGALIVDLESGSFTMLPDNFRVLKKLENGDLFGTLEAENTYVILDKETYSVRKQLRQPEGTDPDLDLSPDGKTVAYVKNEGLFVSDLEFSQPVLLVASKTAPDAFKSERPRYPMWLDNSRILYRMLGWEQVNASGVINRDGKSGKSYGESKNAVIYPLISGDFLYRGEYGLGCGLLDGNTGQKKAVTRALLEYEGFAFDKNGKWVAFFQTNPEPAEENPWTARFEIRTLIDGATLVKYETEEQGGAPIEDAAAAPDGKSLLFTDLDKTGRRVLYRLEVGTEEKAGE